MTRYTMLLIANAASAAGQTVTTLNYPNDSQLEQAIITALKAIAKNAATGESSAIYTQASANLFNLDS